MSEPKRQKILPSLLGGNYCRPFDSEETNALLHSQGWLAGPELVWATELPDAERPFLGNCYSYSIMPPEQQVWLWRLRVRIELTLDISTNHPGILEVHFLEWDKMFNIFNIDFGFEYLYRVILEAMTKTPIMPYIHARKPNIQGTFYMDLSIPLNILPPTAFPISGWMLSSNGFLFRDAPKLLSNNQVPALGAHILPLSQLRNLRPSRTLYVLRYFMLVVDCDVPIIEAIFVAWPNPYPCDMRLFPQARLPKYYKKNAHQTFDVVY
jgi:hypothetical protein